MAREQSLRDVDRLSQRATHSGRRRLRFLSKMVRQRTILDEARDDRVQIF
jgi:hypothetical protein